MKIMSILTLLGFCCTGCTQALQVGFSWRTGDAAVTSSTIELGSGGKDEEAGSDNTIH